MRVRLCAGEIQGRVELRVIDQGPGVPDAVKESMFQPFQRLGDAPKGAGVGLGLAVARGLTEALDGSVWAEDTPGGGLTVVVSLPAAAPAAKAHTTGSDTSTDRHRRARGACVTRVLVVDDEAALARALAINLKARRYEVDVAVDGRTALELAARKRPDVVLLDLGLPDMDGVEVIAGLRGWTDVPIIVLSARQLSDDKVEALDAGADDFVTKPFGMDELLARLRAAIRRGAAAIESDTPVVVTTADFTIDLAAKRARRNGQEVHLTPTEWHLLEVLVRNRGRLVSQRALLQEVWGPQYQTETNYLRVYSAQLRRKLEPDPSRPRYLITEPGLGYRFEVPD